MRMRMRGCAVAGLNPHGVVAGVPFGYDGNLTGGGVWSYGHNAVGRRRSTTLNGW